MNLKIGSYLCCIALFCISIPFNSVGQSPSHPQSMLVDQIATQFAIADQLKEQPQSIRSQFEQNPLNLSPKTNKRILNRFSEAYRTNRLVADFKAALQQNLNKQFIDSIARQLDTPAIRAVTGAQQEYYTLQGKRKRIVTRYDMEQQPPSAERTSAIATLVDTTTIADGSVESSVLILRSLLKAMIQSNEQMPFSEGRLNAITENFRTQMQSQAARQANRQLLVTYHNVDINDLNRYVSFMQSPAGQALDKAISQSMKSAYQAAAQRFSKAVESGNS